jgi:type IV pilus assembly protein PilB
MGVQPYLVASALIGIIAQRLVRMLCQECKEEFYLEDPAEMRLLGVEEPTYIFKARKGGCKACGGTGYKGRTAIHEVLIAQYNVKEIVVHGGTTADIKEQAVKNGTKLLRDNVADLVIDGKSTMEELIKATYSI